MFDTTGMSLGRAGMGCSYQSQGSSGPPRLPVEHLPKPTFTLDSSTPAGALTAINHDAPFFNYDEDEDDESVDEAFSDEEMMFEYEAGIHVTQKARDTEDDVTQKLLDFAEMVSGDIRKFFGRRKGDDDSCDIYEDKWTSGKSGRELYYADLLRIAQGGDGERSRSPNSQKLDSRKGQSVSKEYSGRVNKKLGLGPLAELFQTVPDKKTNKGKKKVKRLNMDHNNRVPDFIPMQKRKFPQSFWQEPGLSKRRIEDCLRNRRPGPGAASGLLASSQTPDFSDLLESWAGEEGGQHGIPESRETVGAHTNHPTKVH